NSRMELRIGHNVVERCVRRRRPDAMANAAAGRTRAAGAQPDAGSAPPPTPGAWARGRGNFIDRVPAGPLRLANRQLAGQVGWLLPLAIMGLVFGAVGTGFPAPPSPARPKLLLWAGSRLSS